jgi:DNA-binding MarR family transcriptional regulator
LRYLNRANRFSRNPAALAAYLGATRGTVSQTLMALESKGLVTKETDARDRRSVRLALTEAGTARLAGDASVDFAKAAAATGDGAALGDALQRVLASALTQRGGRAFGICETCRHFKQDVHTGSLPHHCALLNEPLAEPDAAAICVEQEAAAG